MKLRQLRESGSHCGHQFGDCGLEIYKLIKNMLPRELLRLHVIEGMVRIREETWPHTWIETPTGIVDPTISQFGENPDLEYGPEGEYREVFTAEEYVEDFEEQFGDILGPDVLGESELLDEAGVTRRRFLQAAGSNILGLLTASGLSPATAKTLVATATSGAQPKLIASMIAATSGDYEPEVAETFKDTKLAYNTLRKLLGSSAAIGAANEDGEEFYLGSIISLNDLPRLLKAGKVTHDYVGEDGTYIEVELPGDQVGNDTLIIASEDNDISVVPVPGGSLSPKQLIKVWWEKWEKWGAGYLDKNMFGLLRRNGIDPKRPNVSGVGYNTGDAREDATGNSRPEEWEGIQDVERLDVPHDYAIASPMHQWYESHFDRQLTNALTLI